MLNGARSIFPLAVLCLLGAAGVQAQDPETVYVLSHIEVYPSATEEVINLLSRYGVRGRNASGNLQFEVLQRIHRPNHFALLEQWQNQEARAAHAASARAEEFRASLAPLLSAAIDEREQHALDVAEGAGAGEVYVLTHIDIIPPFTEQGVGLIRDLVEASRADTGNMRFDALVQSAGVNHLTLVEAWRDHGAHELHTVAPHVWEFREALLPIGGSLYDERLFRPL